MSSLKKLLAVGGILVLLLGVMAGCGEEAPTDEEGEAEGGTIGLAISTLNNPFFVTLEEGAKEAAEDLGYDLVVLDSQDDSSQELSNVEDLVQQEVSVILINPVDSDAVESAVSMANDADIPVITLDRSAEGGEVLSHVASDNVAGGEMAGEFIVDELGGEGKVVELEGVPGASAARDRGEGFHNAVEGTDIDVIASQTANFDRQEGLSVMENILEAEEEIDAVFAHNDEMALGALQAIESSGRDIMVVGFDATDDAREAVSEGSMAATVAQQPALIGSLGVESAADYLEDEEIEEYIPVDLELVTE
ncbi:ribose ABC transporter substrate-binding protein RbsB [Natranaerobius thermophilus]|uniref:Monosaccharide-transporting ATPase n=1 Tax=Natranaerobius thermophilus (strain ATCC BAA-1301 / DSM 18059 / JW/NM-WN-LF) TaxID=457570 RepID=B2A2D4_NATTJ|nr:ribose ABC transporter substrate-binding protein RbsB [Natranaerobius thermophilus]ACB86240.1 Monosaccharide-transporting ATPase [Natranaerobius thermophilus JW/NM-WN-LF]